MKANDNLNSVADLNYHWLSSSAKTASRPNLHSVSKTTNCNLLSFLNYCF